MPTEDAIDAAEERAAMRAFLQRCEVRLSTIHRVATALLSGAGILVLLPYVQRDAVVSVLRALLHGPLSASRLLLAAAVVDSIALALTLLWLVIQQLTRFYFHANHIRLDGTETFTPRFTLTGIRLPLDELGPEATAEYEALRGAAPNVELLVPSNKRGRERIDRQLSAYPALRSTHERSDGDRVDALLELAAARRRPLIEEVVKIEHGMARHMLRLQVVVLRYVKALLVVVITVPASFVAATAASDPAGLSVPDQRWIALTMALWAPITILVVTSPVRWIEGLLRAEGAVASTVRDDPELTRVEDLAAYMALGGWVAAFAGLLVLLVHHPVTGGAAVGCTAGALGSVALLAAALWRWRGPS
ncbi:MAG: hypothetical protein JWN67_150 [Actinomycetia bacterium]|nr:hypothetical protein [Actinomycetes bacterium]